MALKPKIEIDEFVGKLRHSGGGTFEITVPMEIVRRFGLVEKDLLKIKILDKNQDLNTFHSFITFFSIHAGGV